MSFKIELFKQTSWLAFFNIIKQMISWAVTIFVARILVPGDYGIMEMATILTGYAYIFSEMGIGSAIIYKQELSQDDLSSVFWFSLIISLFFATICYFLSYPTAYIFNNKHTIPITRLVSFNFIFQGVKVVPLNLLKKNMYFKKIGIIQTISTIVSCLSMYIMAVLGAGVYTLVGGTLILSFSSMIFSFLYARWIPSFCFNFNATKELLSFGVYATLSRSFFYISEKTDRFFAGMAWKPNVLGFYTFALELAQIPTDRIVTLINQVTYPAFSKFQRDKKEFNKLYLEINKITLSIVAPLFIGGFLIGSELIRLVLDAKWYPMTMVFRYLCLVQIVTSLTAVNNFVFMAKGKPQLGMLFHVLRMIIMSLAFFLSVPYGLNAILIPWLTVYVFLCISWIYFTIIKLDISLTEYMMNIFHPLIGSIIMALCIVSYGNVSNFLPPLFHQILIFDISIRIAFGAIVYLSYLIIFDKALILNLKGIRRDK